ncbi:MAG: hypothetical protein AVDCRST_MAG34-1618, partial [uncultured Nocardioidaceae bacterium]
AVPAESRAARRARVAGSGRHRDRRGRRGHRGDRDRRAPRRRHCRGRRAAGDGARHDAGLGGLRLQHPRRRPRPVGLALCGGREPLPRPRGRRAADQQPGDGAGRAGRPPSRDLPCRLGGPALPDRLRGQAGARHLRSAGPRRRAVDLAPAHPRLAAPGRPGVEPAGPQPGGRGPAGREPDRGDRPPRRARHPRLRGRPPGPPRGARRHDRRRRL